jgi:ATPase family protein associated with various cellular activities (AAA)
MKNKMKEINIKTSTNGQLKNAPDESLYNVFNSRGILHGNVYYFSLFGKIPNQLCFENIDCIKLENELRLKFPKMESKHVSTKKYLQHENTYETNAILYPIDDELMVQNEGYNRDIEILYSNETATENLNAVISVIKNCMKSEHAKGTISLLVSGEQFGETFDLSSYKIPLPDLDINKHYNNDLAPVHDTIMKKLNGEKGLVLLHGIPGTGKTTYIRYLVNKVDMKVIYIPQDMTEHIGKPEFVRFLSKHPRSLFIIEDAESLLTDRAFNSNNAIANLLNLSDGILGDCLKIQIICTFNIKLSRIDKALLRKGRIIARYEFGKLTADKSTALLNSLGRDTTTSNEMTLAEIYNDEDTDFEAVKIKEQVGFV